VSDPIRIESLTPEPLPDLQRVSLSLSVSGLPAYDPGSHLLHFPDMPSLEEEVQETKPGPSRHDPNVDLFLDVEPHDQRTAGAQALERDDRPPSPYPDVTLSILDQRGNEIATTYIVEHKEPELDFTLHLTTFEPGASYIARAEMRMHDEVIQTVQVPFELSERT
jgi:hypothetical protein